MCIIYIYIYMYNIASPVAKNKTNKFYSTLCCLTLVFLGIKLINAHQQAPGLYQWLPTETRSELLKYPSFPRWVVEPTAWWENCETPGENPDFIWNVLHRSNLTKKHRILPYFAREHVNSIRVEKIVHLPLGLQTWDLIPTHAAGIWGWNMSDMESARESGRPMGCICVWLALGFISLHSFCVWLQATWLFKDFDLGSGSEKKNTCLIMPKPTPSKKHQKYLVTGVYSLTHRYTIKTINSNYRILYIRKYMNMYVYVYIYNYI